LWYFPCVPLCPLWLRLLQKPVIFINRRQEARLLPYLRQLLERIGDLEQCRLAPGAPEEGDPDRQPPEVSTCHVDIGIARNGGGARTASGGVITVDQVGEPGGSCRGGDERIEFELIHDEVDALRAGEFLIHGQRIDIFFCTERSLLLRLKKNVLPEVGHFAPAIALVEFNHVLQTLNRSIAAACEIGCQVGLEFVVKDGKFALVELANGGNIGGIDDLRASLLHLADEGI